MHVSIQRPLQIFHRRTGRAGFLDRARAQQKGVDKGMVDGKKSFPTCVNRPPISDLNVYKREESTKLCS